MLDIYTQAKNSISEVAIPVTGSEIDTLRKTIVENIQVAQRHCDQLMGLGCINAHIHFKSDQKTMFMNKPAGEDGRRTYIHVGVNPDKQKEAIAKVHRENKRKRIVDASDKIAESARELDWQLKTLLWRYELLLKEAEKLTLVINEPDEPNEPSAAQEKAIHER